MAGGGSDSFYADLPELQRFEEVAALERYAPAPSDWSVVITDVRGSTKAIEEGRYKDVNALGVSCIVAVRNAIRGIEVPFVFGGDGATLLVPTARLDAVDRALRGLRATAESAFSLGLRAGRVPVSELREAGHDVLVARYRASPAAVFAMFGGSGLTVAERWVKDPSRGAAYEVGEGEASADMSGFQCRWQPIPTRRGLVISLLVQARAEDRREAALIYASVVERILRVLGDDGRPVAPETLHLAADASAFDAEARLKSARASGAAYRWRRLQASTVAAIGRVLLSRGWSAFGFPGARYRDEVTANTDYRKFDDTLRMVLDLSAEQRDALVAELEDERACGRIVFGVHAADAALMTCVIEDFEDNHVHFVDGAAGGYALAAKQLKAQLAGK